jgi:hypothetical protein
MDHRPRRVGGLRAPLEREELGKPPTARSTTNPDAIDD